MLIFECFWKGLAMILRGRIVTLIKDKLVDIAMNKSGPLLSVLFTIINGVWRASKHWNESEVKMIENDFIVPILRIIFFNRNSAEAFQMLESSASSFCNRRDPKRLKFLFDFITDSINEISMNMAKYEHNSAEEMILVHLIDFASSLFYSIFDNGFLSQYLYYSNEKVLPAFVNNFDFDNCTITTVSALSKFCCSIMNTSMIDRKEIVKNEQISDLGPNWASIPFEKIFDQQFINKRYDKLVIFLIFLLTPASLGLRSCIPFVSDRFEQIFIILSNLTTRFHSCGSQLILQVGLLHWEKYPDLLTNSVLRKIKDVIIPSFSMVQHGWWIKCNIITFLHVICVRNMFILPIDVYKMIMKEILPLLIIEKNENVRESSMELLVFLVNAIYGGQFDILSQECLEIFKKNNKSNDVNNEEFATATACALLHNMSLINCCPKWLPLVFNELENIYFKGTTFKNVIQKTVKDFWARHGIREIPELEEYRFSLCESYYA